MEIELSNSNKVVLVDTANYGWLNRYNWYLHPKGYAESRIENENILMHRLILGLRKHDGMQTDHANRDKLDNRRSNLRCATRSQNRANSKKREKEGIRSQFKGVSWTKSTSKWRAVVICNGQSIHLGYFHDEEEAAHAYDKAAIELWGEFAKTNF